MHKQPLIKKLLRYTRNLLIFFFASTLLAVIIYRFMPVYVTPLMVIRSVQQVFSGDKPRGSTRGFLLIRYLPTCRCGHSLRRQPFCRTQRVRPRRNQESDERKRNTQTETGSKHHQSADSQECVLMAAIVVGTQRARSLLYVSHRTLLVERANHGSLSQLYRNGKWHLRRTSNRKK